MNLLKTFKFTFSNNSEAGISIISFLIANLTISILVVCLLQSEIFNLKKNRRLQKIESAENNLINCFSALLPKNNNSSIKGISFSHWHNSINEISPLKKSIIYSKTNLNSLTPNSPILEFAKINLPIMKRTTSNSLYTEYTSSYKIFNTNLIPYHSNFILLNPWNSIIIDDKLNKNKLNNKIILNNNSKLLIPFLNQEWSSNIQSINLERYNWISAIESYGIIIHTKEKNIEFHSIINSDRQPICNDIEIITKIGNICNLSSKIKNKIINLSFDCPNYIEDPLSKLEALEKWS